MSDPIVMLLAAAEKTESLLQRLDPERRARVLMALLGLVLVGLLLLAIAWVGARFVIRVARQRPPPRERGPSDWRPAPPVDAPLDNVDPPPSDDQ